MTPGEAAVLARQIAVRNGLVCMALLFFAGAVCGFTLTRLQSATVGASIAIGAVLIASVAVTLMYFRSGGLMFLPKEQE